MAGTIPEAKWDGEWCKDYAHQGIKTRVGTFGLDSARELNNNVVNDKFDINI